MNVVQSELLETRRLLADAPVARITAEQHSSHTFRFDTFASTGHKLVKVVWHFGDGTVSKEPIVFKTFSGNGSFRVKLTVTDKSGKSDAESIHYTTGNTYKTASISGTYFRDDDGDGKRGVQEYGIQGATLWLDANNNGKLDTGERTTKTRHAGEYVFLNLKGGRHIVRAPSPSEGYFRTGVDAVEQNVSNGAAVHGVNFSTQRAGEITGSVLIDTDGDGVGHPHPEVNAKVWLDDNNNGVQDSGEDVANSPNGSYRFRGVKPGKHYVRPVLAGSSLFQIAPRAASVRVDVASGQTAQAESFVLSANGASISGRVWNDTRPLGIIDNSDSLPGISLALDSNGNGRADESEPRAVTNKSGLFSFTALGAGRYRVLVLTSGYAQVYPGSPVEFTLGAFSQRDNISIGLRKR